jgi:hypothetical protein
MPNDTKEPLYILEGKIITERKMKSLDQNTIERIDVLKGESAMVIYGSKAKIRGRDHYLERKTEE